MESGPTNGVRSSPRRSAILPNDAQIDNRSEPPRKSRLGWKFAIPAVLVVSTVFAFGVYARPQALAKALRGFDYLYLVPILCLAMANYLIRFARWQYLLRVVGVKVERRRSLGIFFSGLAMSVTPGKLGELFKCFMLKREVDARYAASVPVVLDERLTDLVAVVLLAAVGVARYPAGRTVFVAGLAAVAALVTALAFSPRLAERLAPWLSRRSARRGVVEGTRETATTFVALLRARTFAWAVALGVAAWSCECFAFWLVFRGLHWHGLSLQAATFVYAVATLAGAISLLPGGLGVTEGTMAALLAVLAVPRAAAAAATLVIRACTLWFAVVLGVAAYALHMRRLARMAGAPSAVAADGAPLLKGVGGP